MEGIYVRLGQNIRRNRTRLGLTLEDLGELSGLHPSYVGQVERGTKKASLAAIDRLARALKTSVGKLVAP